jgi:hypothetical protein
LWQVEQACAPEADRLTSEKIFSPSAATALKLDGDGAGWAALPPPSRPAPPQPASNSTAPAATIALAAGAVFDAVMDYFVTAISVPLLIE